MPLIRKPLDDTCHTRLLLEGSPLVCDDQTPYFPQSFLRRERAFSPAPESAPFRSFLAALQLSKEAVSALSALTFFLFHLFRAALLEASDRYSHRPAISLNFTHATIASGLKLLLHAALRYYYMRPEATTACGLKLLLHEALSYCCMRP